MALCIECGRRFTPRNKTHRFCVAQCRSASNLRKNPYPSLANTLNISSGTVGALNELRVAVDLMMKGFHVFRALSPACPCDLLAFQGKTLLRIEVKTAYRSATTNKLIRPPLQEQRGRDFDILACVLLNEIIYEPDLPVSIALMEG